MSRFIKWAAPVVAFAVLVSLAAIGARAEDAKKDTGKIEGTVKDSEGKAVSGLTVSLFHPMEKAAPKQSAKLAEKGGKGEKPVAVASATTDTDGKFTMNDVPAGDYMVIAKQKGQGQARQKVTVKAGETASVDLKLEKGKGGGGEKPAPTAK
jgi:hypothetical protein